DSLTPRLIAIVAERTGYPAEMLGLDINLEGELGIDSIKRVEIIAAFRREAIPGMQEPPAEFMEHLAAAKTMRRILEVVSQMRGGPATAPPAPPPEAPHSQAPAQLDPDDLLTTLLRIVAERTGYPAEMLDLDIHLESELGIDSIKRVEIIAAFRREVRPDLVEPPPELMERLTAAKTMRSIIDALSLPAAANGHGAAASPVASQPPPNGAASENGAVCPRCVAEAVAAPVTRLDQLSAGAVIVSADDHGIANHWAEQLRAAGHPVVQLSHADLADRESARRAFEIVRREFGAIAAVAHLAPLDDAPPWPTISRRAWQERFALDVEGMLYLLQALEPELTAPGPRVRVLCATLGAGDFARPGTANEREATHPWRGGLAGLLKVAACEWPQHAFRAVDFAEFPTTEQLDRELRAAGAVEIAYRGTQRLTVETRREELPALETPHAATTLTRDSVVLVTGGAKGITAQIVAELARQVPARFILLGRSPLPDTEEPAATAGIEPDHLLRPAIIGQLRTAGESLTPARVEAVLARIKSDRELRRNLAAIASTGAEVEYVVCDLRDPLALGQTLQALQDKYGVIDALIHGAGIIDDRAIKDKTTSSFERVVGTKVDALLDLLARLDLTRLRLIALFGSTSGIFGNSGQGDYAAANEILNRCARRLQSIWSGKVVTLNWGPWSGAGMVTPEVAEKMRAQGVDLIPVAAGSAAACREMLSPRGDNPRVVLGRGPWLDAERLRAGRLDLSASGPLLAGHSVEVGGDGRVEARVRLNPQTRYLRDHCIEGKAVLPVAVAVGFMAEAAHRARPAWHVASVANVRMLGGITVEGAGREIIVAAEPLGQESGVGQWRVRITAADVPQRTLYDA
ncbi:MAG: SDR family NAD(P)-dependent oxidoreductase, partial [Planctomycetaceae bacterium]|nr:SDR family NAD(P)-dependent oxidoreductase [Planctomycetaceae bacterium]